MFCDKTYLIFLDKQKMKALDKLDRRILYLLDEDSRRPFADIARKVRRGSDIVRYRVERMLDEKIIGNFFTIVDFGAMGQTIYKNYIRLSGKKAAEKRVC